MYTGSCLCGRISFEISADLAPVQICHCTQCRKAQGSAFATNIPVNESDVRFAGEESLKSFESSPGKQRVFCAECGSAIYSKTEKLPGVLRIRAGTIDGNLATRPAAHNFYSDKANWFEITDGLPKHATKPVSTG